MSLEKFGRYEIKSELGRGGMATVYQAYDPRFERDVAIKVLPHEFLHDPLFRARFEREAKTIALIEHPAIVPVYDFGEEDGQPFIVMRYMAGGSLSEKLHQGPMPSGSVVELYNRLAPALDAAHKKGIVHRDLKPGNILYDQYNNAFISDFGIARIANTGGATLTGGNILGTPTYMSPEQVQGDSEVDGRSDIYAMGVILYQLLTGSAPYQSTTPARVMMMHILEPVPQILEAKASLPPTLQGVIDRAMAKEPEQRFSNMTEMAAAIENVFKSATSPSLKPLMPADSTIVSAGPTRSTPQKTIQSAGATIKAQPLTQTPSAATPPPPTYEAMPTPIPSAPVAQRQGFPIWAAIGGGMLILVLLGVIGGMFLLTISANQPTQTAPAVAQASPTVATATEAVVVISNTEAPVLTDTPSPSNTPEPLATETSEPTMTQTPPPSPTPTLPAILEIGGADKIALTKNNDIWIMNVDGSELVQLTNDGAEKRNLSWLPDGTHLAYISGKCIKTAEYPSGGTDVIACFDTAAIVMDFKVSPDGTKAAISMDREHIYVVPFDIEKLKQARFRRDLAPMAICPTLGPFVKHLFKTVAWSSDSKSLAYVFGAPEAGVQVDTIRVIDVSRCYDGEIKSLGVQFPGAFFKPREYSSDPTLGSWTWDGQVLFALTGKGGQFTGYGELNVFNHENNRVDIALNPIDGQCCYDAVEFTPDGRHLFFLYRDTLGDNSIYLYLVPYASIGSGEKYIPLALPANFLDIKTHPEIAFRTTQP